MDARRSHFKLLANSLLSSMPLLVNDSAVFLITRLRRWWPTATPRPQGPKDCSVTLVERAQAFTRGGNPQELIRCSRIVERREPSRRSAPCSLLPTTCTAIQLRTQGAVDGMTRCLGIFWT
jgi:hypothetical protein